MTHVTQKTDIGVTRARARTSLILGRVTCVILAENGRVARRPNLSPGLGRGLKENPLCNWLSTRVT